MTILHSSSGRPYCTTDAKVQVVLPQLSEMRLVALTKQLSRNRKQLYLTQGNLAMELKTQNRHNVREHKLAEDRHRYVSTPFKKTLSHVKGVQKCLERRKTELCIDTSKNEKYGQYGGLSVKSLKGDIEKIMKDQSYQNLKRREAKRQLADGRADGRIMNIKLCQPILESILNRPSMARRREQALGFDSFDSPVASAKTSTRQPRTTFHLPPVTATRLYTPAKSRRAQPDVQVKQFALDRANTVA